MEHLVQDAKQNVLNGLGNDWPQGIGYRTPVFVQILIGALLQHLNAIEQIIQSKFQSTDFVFNSGIGYIIENMAKLLVQMRFRVHRDVHIFWFEPTFSMSIQWNDENSTLHVIISFDAHFWQKYIRFPTVVDRAHFAGHNFGVAEPSHNCSCQRRIYADRSLALEYLDPAQFHGVDGF